MSSGGVEPPVRIFREALGLHPWRQRWAQARIALQGQEDVPPSQFDLSSLDLFESLRVQLHPGAIVPKERTCVLQFHGRGLQALCEFTYFRVDARQFPRMPGG